MNKPKEQLPPREQEQEGLSQDPKEVEKRRRNFFEKKRLPNHELGEGEGEEEHSQKE